MTDSPKNLDRLLHETEQPPCIGTVGLCFSEIRLLERHIDNRDVVEPLPPGLVLEVRKKTVRLVDRQNRSLFPHQVGEIDRREPRPRADIQNRHARPESRSTPVLTALGQPDTMLETKSVQLLQIRP